MTTPGFEHEVLSYRFSPGGVEQTPQVVTSLEALNAELVDRGRRGWEIVGTAPTGTSVLVFLTRRSE
jgi:hypothetical protein